MGAAKAARRLAHSVAINFLSRGGFSGGGWLVVGGWWLGGGPGGRVFYTRPGPMGQAGQKAPSGRVFYTRPYLVVAGPIQGKAGKPGKASKTGPGQTKPRLGTTGKPAKQFRAAN